jgi:hypothetical protein
MAHMNKIRLIQDVYEAAARPVENPMGLITALQRWYLNHPQHHYLHPCLINGNASLVCLADLSRLNRTAFIELQAIADAHGVWLKEDKRLQDVGRAGANRRKQLGLALSFCLGVIATSRGLTAAELSAANNSSAQTGASFSLAHSSRLQAVQDSDKIIHLRYAKPPTAAEILSAYTSKKDTLSISAAAENKIKDLLNAAYQPEADDPATVRGDIAEIAHYYAQYPQAIALLDNLNEKELTLKYQVGTWQTQAWGNAFAVERVTIFFDTRLAAQLLEHADCHANPACAISPADALLHELLHAHLMLNDSERFIETGGFEPSLYPFEHEREVIADENRLYQEMNSLDGLSRPLRNRHNGRLFHVQCAACVPGILVSSNERHERVNP